MSILGNFRYKTTRYTDPGVHYHITDPNCVCGLAYVVANGGPGAGVRLDGTVAIGTKGSDAGFNNGAKYAIAMAAGVGGIIGDQGPGGTVNSNFDDFEYGRSGGGTGHDVGGIGGGGIGEAWGTDGLHAPRWCGYGSGASGLPAGVAATKPDGGPVQTGTGGGEGGRGRINFEGRGPYWTTVTDSAFQSVINDNAFRLTVGLPGLPADPGAGGAKGGEPRGGRVVVHELIFEPSAALVALLTP